MRCKNALIAGNCAVTPDARFRSSNPVNVPAHPTSHLRRWRVFSSQTGTGHREQERTLRHACRTHRIQSPARAGKCRASRRTRWLRMKDRQKIARCSRPRSRYSVKNVLLKRTHTWVHWWQSVHCTCLPELVRTTRVIRGRSWYRSAFTIVCPPRRARFLLWTIHQYFISTWRWVAWRCSVLCWLSRFLSKGGGKGQVTCREATAEAVLMRDESDAPDFL
ncbi:hypothetical protein OKW45_002555 [Paraburkholderia sp. WSM4175]